MIALGLIKGINALGMKKPIVLRMKGTNIEEAKEISAAVPGNLKSNRDASWLFNGRLSPVVP